MKSFKTQKFTSSGTLQVHDNIIGYLLGALDDAEMAEFEAELESNAELQRRVHQAARSLQVWEDADEEPPAGLVDATCQFVHSQLRQPRDRSRQLAFDRDSWSLFDVMIAVSVLFVGSLLFLPAINNSRLHAQVAGCQDNLRRIGGGLIQFSSLSPTQSFPSIPHDSRLGVAGIYAPILLEAGFLSDDQCFYCPSYRQREQRSIPSTKDLLTAIGQKCEELQTIVGGDYGFHLGQEVNGNVRARRNSGSPHFALMADLPVCATAPTHRALQHRNVLMECGGVRVIPVNMAEWRGDHLFVNQQGKIRAGVTPNDCVIGASYMRPLPLD